MTILERIQVFNQTRNEALLDYKFKAMICGDLHLENFGSFKIY